MDEIEAAIYWIIFQELIVNMMDYITGKLFFIILKIGAVHLPDRAEFA